jgi:hypothetical protein
MSQDSAERRNQRSATGIASESFFGCQTTNDPAMMPIDDFCTHLRSQTAQDDEQ